MSTAYDQVRYPSSPRKESHPSRLQTLACLAGMRPAPLSRCRVLELGCGTGANLIPFAQDYPDAECLGIDLAESAIEAARADAAGLASANLRYEVGDLATWASPGREFDYIIVHGVFSWVPEHVRQGILRICRDHLSPHGVAFISYNAFPGCHFRKILWDILRFHTRGISDPEEKVQEALRFATVMRETLPDGATGANLRAELEIVLERSPSVLYHDDLAEINQPFYVEEVASLAAAYSLQYLSDADYSRERGIPAGIVTRDRAQERQYSDMFSMRRFRETLLCHAEVQLDPVIRWEYLHSLYVGSSAQPGEVEEDGGRKFAVNANCVATIGDPEVQSQLLQLVETWPAMLPLERIWPDEALLDRLIRLWMVGLLELRVEPPKVAAGLSARPATSPLARLQLKRGSRFVTNQRHADVVLADELTRALIAALDGSRTIPEIGDHLFSMLESGAIPVPDALKDVQDKAALRTAFDDMLSVSMKMLLRLNLLFA